MNFDINELSQETVICQKLAQRTGEVLGLVQQVQSLQREVKDLQEEIVRLKSQVPEPEKFPLDFQGLG